MNIHQPAIFRHTENQFSGFPPPFCHRVQKQRAAKSEDAVGHMNAQLIERDGQMEELRARLEQFDVTFVKVAKEKSQITAENAALKT